MHYVTEYEILQASQFTATNTSELMFQFNSAVTEVLGPYPSATLDPATAEPRIWDAARQLLKPADHPGVKELLRDRAFDGWDEQKLGPRPLWTPTQAEIESTNVARLMKDRGFETVEDLYQWSIDNGQEFWTEMMNRLGVKFRTPYDQLVDTSNPEEPEWFPGSTFNIADTIFDTDPNTIAIVYQAENGEMKEVTYGELDKLSNKVANALQAQGVQQGDNIAIDVTQNIEWVATVLGAVKAGCTVWAIPDQSGGPELDLRLQQIEPAPKLIITQDKTRAITYDSKTGEPKQQPIYTKIKESVAPKAIVIMDADSSVELRSGDMDWNSFLENTSDEFTAVDLKPDHKFVAHFSSGTSNAEGNAKPPKVIEWGLDTVIKSATDTHLHRDMRKGDRLLWTTSPGWMMGSTVLFGSLLNKSTMALYDGNTTTKGVGKFLQSAKVNVAGLVPSVVKQWRQSRCMEEFDLSSVHIFCSTGEPSNLRDQFYVMSLVPGFAPSAEGMGGTEIGGGYLGTYPTKPSAPCMFHGPSFGTRLVVEGKFSHPMIPNLNSSGLDDGEMGIVMQRGGTRIPPMGLSTRIRNYPGRHHTEYFDRGFLADGLPVREHKDLLQSLPGGWIRSNSRADATCNINGIKTAYVTLEQLVKDARIPDVNEIAFVHVRPHGPGEDQIYALYSLKTGVTVDEEALRKQMRRAIIDGGIPQQARIDHMLQMEPGVIQGGGKVSHTRLRKVAQAHYDQTHEQPVLRSAVDVPIVTQ